MYSNVTEAFINASKGQSTHANAVVTVGDTELYGLVSMGVERDLCGNGEFSIGNFNAATCVFSYLTETDPDVYDGQAIKPSAGLLIEGETEEDDAFEMLPLGEFFTTNNSVTKSGNVTTVTCYDRAYYLNEPYETSLTFPSNVANVVNDVCASYGLVLSSRFASMQASTFKVYEKPTGTVRSVIAKMALLLGANAWMDRDGKLDFIRVDVTAESSMIYSIGEALRHGFSVSDDSPLEIGSLQVSYTRDVTSGSGANIRTESVTDEFAYDTYTGDGVINIETTDVRNQTETNALGRAVLGTDGLSYCGFSADIENQVFLDFGDWVSVEYTELDDYDPDIDEDDPFDDTEWDDIDWDEEETDTDTSEVVDEYPEVYSYRLLILSQKIEYDGALSCMMSAVAPQDGPDINTTTSGMISDQIKDLIKALETVRLSVINVDFLEARKAKVANLVADELLRIGPEDGSHVVSDGSSVRIIADNGAELELTGDSMTFRHNSGDSSTQNMMIDAKTRVETVSITSSINNTGSYDVGHSAADYPKLSIIPKQMANVVAVEHKSARVYEFNWDYVYDATNGRGLLFYKPAICYPEFLPSTSNPFTVYVTDLSQSPYTTVMDMAGGYMMAKDVYSSNAVVTPSITGTSMDDEHGQFLRINGNLKVDGTLYGDLPEGVYVAEYGVTTYAKLVEVVGRYKAVILKVPADDVHDVKYALLSDGYASIGQTFIFKGFGRSSISGGTKVLEYRCSLNSAWTTIEHVVIHDANSDGKTYGRNNGAWTEITGGGGGGNPTFVIEQVTLKDNVSVAINATNSSGNVSVAKSGYKAVGVTGFSVGNATSGGTSASYCMIYQVNFDGTNQTAQMAVRNVGTNTSASANAVAAAKIKYVVSVLYMKL